MISRAHFVYRLRTNQMPLVAGLVASRQCGFRRNNKVSIVLIAQLGNIRLYDLVGELILLD